MKIGNTARPDSKTALEFDFESMYCRIGFFRPAA